MLKECPARVDGTSLCVIKYWAFFWEVCHIPWETMYRSPKVTAMCGFGLILSCPVDAPAPLHMCALPNTDMLLSTCLQSN